MEEILRPRMNMFVERLKEMDEQKYSNIVISLIMVCNVYSGKKAKILKI